MLEIIAIWQLTKNIGQIVEGKGHRSGGYKFLTVALWFGGEFVGAFLGVLITGGIESAQCLVYLIAITGAIIGGGISYLIAKNLTDLTPPPRVSQDTVDTYQKLTKLKELLDSGQISQEEYESQKEKVLSEM